jgi:beta-glucosidase
MNYIKEACEAARRAEIVVIFAGLTVLYESEGFDREHMRLPEIQNVLITEVSKVNPNIIVVLSGGAPVEMPWADQVKGILNTYLSGQAAGSAVVDLLLGKANPSGKLAETYPVKYDDCLAATSFPGGPRTVEYKESIFVGYRYYDTAKIDVLFPFGHGLSYTSFEYSDLNLSKESINDNEELKVAFKIKNIGTVPGCEVAQLYIHDPESTIYKAEKELKGFEKVYLNPGEEKVVELTLDSHSFAYYNVNIHDWHVEGGEYEILVGASSRDIRLSKEVYISSTINAEIPDYVETAPTYYTLKENIKCIPEKEFKVVYGKPLPINTKEEGEPFTVNSTLGDVKRTFVGWLLYKYIIRHTVSMSGRGKDERTEATRNMMRKTMPQNPLRGFAMMSGGSLNFGMLDGLLLMMNGRPFKGIVKLFKSIN